MSAVLEWVGDEEGVPAQAFTRPSKSRSRRSQTGELPAELTSVVWRGTDLGRQAGAVVSSGFGDLDRELPGGGWPCQDLSEILSPQPSVLEWRLLGPTLRRVVGAGGCVVVIGPPKHPHLPGLAHTGIDERHLVWIQADAPAERLWCTEQLIKGGACGALVSWLPQARPEQIRRLQVCAQGCDGPVFLMRPAATQHEASAAPLRVMATYGLDWELQVQVLKRRGPAHDGVVHLASMPGGLAAVLTPRLLKPSVLLASRESAHGPSRSGSAVPLEGAANVVGSTVASNRPRRHATAP